jgi:hypothetical protein
MATKSPSSSYVVRAAFRAPLEFVYQWCTDFSPQDARYEREEYSRKILRRSTREVVYEDLSEESDGWHWSRHVVRLSPPDRWHSDTIGSHRAMALDYKLTRLPGERTQLVLKVRRRPYGVGAKKIRRAHNGNSMWPRPGRISVGSSRRTTSGRSRARRAGADARSAPPQVGAIRSEYRPG